MANEYKSVISDKKREANRLMTKEQVTACNVAIHTASAAAGAAGVIPIPVADAVPITGAQVTMAIALGKIFDQKLTDTAAKGLISAAASTLVGRSLIKLIPVAGWIASAAIAAGVTEAIGWSLAVDFAKGYKAGQNIDTDDEGVVSEMKTTSFSDINNAPDGEEADHKDSLSDDFESVFGEEDI